MRKTLPLGLLAVLTLSGRPIAAPAGNDGAPGSHVTASSATLSISGTSTMHAYTVSTKALKVSAANASTDDVQGLLQPDALQGFELQIAVNTFTSDKNGLTKQMFKAMKADKHPDYLSARQLHGRSDSRRRNRQTEGQAHRCWR